MEQANYILKSNEAVLVPVNSNPMLDVLKKVVWIIIAVIIVSSFLFKENIFGELSSESRIFLIIIAVSLMFVGNKHKRVPSPFEIRFYDDFLVVYREKYYYSRKVSRMEFYKFFYSDIKTCELRKKTQRVNIYGVVEATWYNYNSDGSVPKQPTYHKTVDGICYFYTSASTNVDYAKEIEDHSPIKVVIEDN